MLLWIGLATTQAFFATSAAVPKAKGRGGVRAKKGGSVPVAEGASSSSTLTGSTSGTQTSIKTSIKGKAKAEPKPKAKKPAKKRWYTSPNTRGFFEQIIKVSSGNVADSTDYKAQEALETIAAHKRTCDTGLDSSNSDRSLFHNKASSLLERAYHAKWEQTAENVGKKVRTRDVEDEVWKNNGREEQKDSELRFLAAFLFDVEHRMQLLNVPGRFGGRGADLDYSSAPALYDWREKIRLTCFKFRTALENAIGQHGKNSSTSSSTVRKITTFRLPLLQARVVEEGVALMRDPFLRRNWFFDTLRTEDGELVEAKTLRDVLVAKAVETLRWRNRESPPQDAREMMKRLLRKKAANGSTIEDLTKLEQLPAEWRSDKEIVALAKAAKIAM
ncbi:unnamed protein product [Amoebophrya sp. A120]|nr:unnamed protein product [Amoebophrya sp. A120]|eukprot:GSA120T00012837001.1